MAFRRPVRPLIAYWAGRAFDRLAGALFSVEVVGPPAPPSMLWESSWVAAELRATNDRLRVEYGKDVRDYQLIEDLLTRRACLAAYTPPVPVVPGAGS